MSFVDDHRDEFGVEPICAVVEVAPSTYYEHKRRQGDPDRRSLRERRDEVLRDEIARVYNDNRKVYGVHKVWKQLHRERIMVARCTVARLMKQLGLRGVVRGKPPVTTVPSGATHPGPDDLVHRRFNTDAPNRLWVADITYVNVRDGFVYVAFVTDVFSRRIVGWRVDSSLHTQLCIDALNQAIAVRLDGDTKSLIHHSDRGSQYLSLRYSERLVESGIQPSVGAVGNSYDNALAETIFGLYKTELINQQRWTTIEDVEYATLEWIDWYNNQRLYTPLGDIPPAEYEANHYRDHQARQPAGLKQTSLR